MIRHLQKVVVVSIIVMTSEKCLTLVEMKRLSQLHVIKKMSDLIQFFRLFTKSVAKDATSMTDQCTFQAFGHFTIDRFEVNLFIEIVLKSIFPTKPLSSCSMVSPGTARQDTLDQN